MLNNILSEGYYQESTNVCYCLRCCKCVICDECLVEWVRLYGKKVSDRKYSPRGHEYALYYVRCTHSLRIKDAPCIFCCYILIAHYRNRNRKCYGEYMEGPEMSSSILL